MLILAKRAISTPKDVRGLSGWFDASVGLFNAPTGGSPVAANGQVARWEDQSGNGRHVTQATTTARPILVTNSIGTFSAVQFASASSQFLSGEASPNNTIGNTLSGRGVWAWVVMKFNSPTAASNQTILGFTGGYSATQPTQGFGFWSMRRWNLSGSGGADYTLGGQLNVGGGNREVGIGLQNQNTGRIARLYFPRTTVRTFSATVVDSLGGTQSLASITDSGAPTGTSYLARFAIGCNLSQTFTALTPLNGAIAEIAVFSRQDPLTATELAGINRYFTKKYSLA